MKENHKTAKKLTLSVITLILLCFCLGITTYALYQASVSVKDNYFHTGTVDINLNDGKPIIEAHEFLFEPGMTVKKDFFIENNSTWSVYYKIYFNHVSGGLADVLDVTIKDGETTLFSGKAAELTRANVQAAKDVLKVNEKRDLTVYFYFPENAGNRTQDLNLSFDMCADAVQTKNNPDRSFE